MPDRPFSEAEVAQLPLLYHAEGVGWKLVARDVALEKRGGEGSLFFYPELRAALRRLNPGFIEEDGVEAVISRLESVHPTMEGNRDMLEWLRGHKTAYDANDKRHRNVRLVDFEDIENNTFQVTAEWAFRSGQKKGNRADCLFLINGLPVAIVENKGPKLADALERGIKQLRRYEVETPELLLAPQVFNITNLLEYFYGVTWSTGRKDIFNWKAELGGSANSGEPILFPRSPEAAPLAKVAEEAPPLDPVPLTYKAAIESFFGRRHFLDLLGEWILFFIKDDELRKTILRQHQTRAALKVVERCADPLKKRGLIWHTQGSGKTFTLITAARLILEDTDRFPGATVMMVVDRNELEGQLSGWVERLLGDAKAGPQINVAYATSRAKLQDLLDQDFRGLIVSMVHKFNEMRKDSCTRENFFVLIDEAHRSTGGDLGNYLMGALPNATLIGFTGTPVDKTAHGKGTFKVFGVEDERGYLDKYSIRESIADGTTVRLRHALAPGHMCVPQKLLEEEFLSLAASEGVSDIEELNRILDRAVNLKSFLKADDRVEKVARFVAEHFRQNVEPMGYKAFLVAVDREACALYKEALDRYLPPEYSVPIYTANPDDAVDRPKAAAYQISSDGEKRARKIFPKADAQPKIFIVTDKLLTGYDAPVLYALYLDKPMRDHVLLQSVSRVNRPYEDAKGIKKPCGLIIDFIGVLKELTKALAFDSQEVSGAIEDLDLLRAHFLELIAGPVQTWLAHFAGLSGESLVERICAVFLDKGKRQNFTGHYKELETLYEILSPSSELRDSIEPYNRLAEIFCVMRNRFANRPEFYADVAHKTERLVQQNATAHGLDVGKLNKFVEFDELALDALRRKSGAAEAKVMNLVKSLQGAAAAQGEQEPYLIPIAQRADGVLATLEDRQVSTAKALEKLEALMQEKLTAEGERKKTGLNGNNFNTYWHLHHERKLAGALALSTELNAAFENYPAWVDNADELRQLKAALYKILLPVVKGKQMVDLADEILRLPRR